MLGFLLRKHAGDDFVEAELLSNRARCRFTVTGQHDDSQAVLVQRIDGGKRGFLYWVGDADEAGGFAVHGNKHRGLPQHAERVGAPGQFVCVNIEVPEQVLVAQNHSLAVHVAHDPFAGHGLELRQVSHGCPTFTGSA